MGDLGEDTAVEGGGGSYTGSVSRDWEIWGPNGGYVAAIALRSAAAHSRLPRPAGLVGHFLGVAGFDPVDIAVTTMRETKRAESLRVSMTQEGRPIFEALVWAVGEGLDGLRHDTTSAPEVPTPESLLSVEEHFAAAGEEPWQSPFWSNIEERPVEWIDDWENRPSRDPLSFNWMRFRPTACFDDPWVDACRHLVLIDVGPWPAVHFHHVPETPFIAPNIDLTVHFHRFLPGSEWLLSRAEAPLAADGLIAGRGEVWSLDGALLASGVSHLLCRPRYPAAP